MDWLFAQPLDSVIFSNRIILIVVATAVASAALSALAMVTVGGGKYAALGCFAIPISFLGGYVMFLGVPDFPSADPLHLLPYIVLVGLIVGIVIDTFSHIESTRLAVVLGWPAVVVVTIGILEMPNFATIAGLPMAVLWLSAVLTNLWLGLEHRFQTTPVVSLFVITIGLGLLAFIGGSKILTILSGILAAAYLGFFALNWPMPRFAFLAVGNLGAAGAVLALAVAQALFTATQPLPLAVLLLVLPMPLIAGRLPFGAGPKAGPMVLLLVSIIPVAAAAAIALHLKGSFF